jgi:serine O-acetyltransferase
MGFAEKYKADLTRYGGTLPGSEGWLRKFHYYFRKVQTETRPLPLLLYRLLFRNLKQKRGIEISYAVKIGEGLYLGHPYNITVNDDATIGKNCNLHKGVLIGQENRGPRKGAPKIGDSVWIGVNAAIVGKVEIGDDVLIAPNSFVNCDVPSHSIVFGNPCIIKHRDNATEGYINNKV